MGPCGAKETIPTLETASLFRISVPRAQTGLAFCMHSHSPHGLSGRGRGGAPLLQVNLNAGDARDMGHGY